MMTESAAIRSSQSARAIPELHLGLLRKSSHREVTVSPIESNCSRYVHSSTRRAYLAAKWYRIFSIKNGVHRRNRAGIAYFCQENGSFGPHAQEGFQERSILSDLGGGREGAGGLSSGSTI